MKIFPAIRAVALLLIVAAPLSAAELLVTHGGDSGVGSLRQAILDANANPGEDRIVDVPGILEIRPTAPLPAITDRTSLEIRARIEGSDVPGKPDGLVIAAPTEAHVSVRNFGGSGILLLPHTGSEIYAGASSCERGIEVRGGGQHVVIGYVGFNAAEGLLVASSHGNLLGSYEGCSFDPCVSNVPLGQLYATGNGTGMRVAGDFNDINAVISDSIGTGAILEGTGNRIKGQVNDNSGLGIVARGANDILASIDGNDLELDGEAAIQVSSAVVTSHPDGVHSRFATFVTGKVVGQPHTRYLVDRNVAWPNCSGRVADPGVAVIVETNGSGQVFFSLSWGSWYEPVSTELRLSEIASGATPEVRDTLVITECIALFSAPGGSTDLALEMSGPALIRHGETFVADFAIRNLGSAAEPEATLYIEPHAGLAWYVDGVPATRSSSNGVIVPIDGGGTAHVRGVLRIEEGAELRATILQQDAVASNNFDTIDFGITSGAPSPELRLEMDPPIGVGRGLARRRFRIINEGEAGAGRSDWKFAAETVAAGIFSPYGRCESGIYNTGPVAWCSLDYIASGESVEGVVYVLSPDNPTRRRAVAR